MHVVVDNNYMCDVAHDMTNNLSVVCRWWLDIMYYAIVDKNVQWCT